MKMMKNVETIMKIRKKEHGDWKLVKMYKKSSIVNIF